MTQKEPIFQFKFKSKKKLCLNLKEEKEAGERLSPAQMDVSRFVLSRPSPNRMRPAHVQEGSLLYSGSPLSYENIHTERACEYNV